MDKKSLSKNFILFIFIIFLAGLFFIQSQFSKQNISDIPYVVMLSLDGFRWDYADKVPTPNLDYIAKNGVKASSMQPSFPSKTFPNHYTIVTGLYPNHHGIVNNSFYDPKMKKYFRIGDRTAVENGNFWGGEPIWVTAEKQGVKSASLFWVGSEAPIKGIYPSIWKKYNQQMPFEDRIDTVISWLQLPKQKRPHLITWYIHQPDSWGHILGPESNEIKLKIIYLDSLVGIFIDKLEKIDIANKINILVTSDHGMGTISKNRVIYPDDYIKQEWLDKYAGSNPFFMFQPKEGYLDSVFFALKKAKHLQVWRKSQIPERLHYGTNPRIMEIVAVADSGWSIEYQAIVEQDKNFNGAHGYDPENKDMHTIFYAIGPAFKKGYVHPAFENIHIYPLIAHILKLDPVDTDGDLNSVKEMLKENQ